MGNRVQGSRREGVSGLCRKRWVAKGLEMETEFL